MKRIGIAFSLFALVFALQACGDDNKRIHKIEPQPNTPLARKDVVRLYNALLTTAIGQDALTGECGNLGKHFDRSQTDPKTIKVKLPFKACQVDKLTINGNLALTGQHKLKDAQPAMVQGALKVAGDIAGTCDVKLHYPIASVFEILAVVNEENADLNVFELSALSGTLCDVDITELIQDAERAKVDAAEAAQAQAARGEAAKAKVEAAKTGTLQAQADKAAGQFEADQANKARAKTPKARAKGKKADEAIAPEPPRPEALAPQAPTLVTMAPQTPAPEALAPEAAKADAAAPPEADKPLSRKVRVPHGRAKKASKAEANPAMEPAANTAG